MEFVDAGCGWRGRGSHGSPNRWTRTGEAGVLMAVSDEAFGVRGRGSHFSVRR